jgi:hypothetical protein
VAERLGLEHAASISAPSIENLRSAGTETPSGRLVIDIERLRESRAAAHAAQSVGVAAPAAGDFQNGDGRRFAPPVAHAPYGAPAGPRRFSPAIARFRVFFGEKKTWLGWLTRPIRILLVSMLMLMLAVSAIAFFSARPTRIMAASVAGEGLSNVARFGVIDRAVGDEGDGRRQSRGAKDARRGANPRARSAGPSRAKRIWNKAKKIFKNPF